MSTATLPPVSPRFEGVIAITKANVYFEGKVISHTILTGAGQRKTLGVILPGSYHFNTEAPERMEMVSGDCSVKLKDSQTWIEYPENSVFEIPGNSSFDIQVKSGSAHYICSFL